MNFDVFGRVIVCQYNGSCVVSPVVCRVVSRASFIVIAKHCFPYIFQGRSFPASLAFPLPPSPKPDCSPPGLRWLYCDGGAYGGYIVP